MKMFGQMPRFLLDLVRTTHFQLGTLIDVESDYWKNGTVNWQLIPPVRQVSIMLLTHATRKREKERGR